MKKNVLILISFILISINILAQNSWVKKANINDSHGRYTAVAFTINGKAYVGLGQILSTATNLRDFWEYDPVLDKWTKKGDYPGKGSYAATAFSINGKGYVCLGGINSSLSANDLWEYTPSTDTWRKRADFPGQARYGASSFVIGDNAYVGTGSYGDPNNYLYDMWVYNSVSDTWKRISDFPGNKRLHATSFAIGSYGYLGTGLSNSTTVKKDMWKYDNTTDAWTAIPDFPGQSRMGMVNFVIGNKAYVGSGYDFAADRSDFYEYNSNTNSWSSAINAPTELARHSGVGFSIGNYGYVGTGIGKVLMSDLWEFGPEVINNILPDSLVRCDGDFPLLIDAGQTFDKYLWSTGETTSSIKVASEGLYWIKVTTKAGNQLTDTVKVKISKPMVDLGKDQVLCKYDSLVLNAGPDFTGGYLWSTPQGAFTSQKIKAFKTGIYTVAATNEFGCKAVDTINLTFADPPRLDLSGVDTLMCGKYTTTLNVSADKAVAWSLDSSDPKIKIDDLTVSIAPGNEGTYPVILTAKDEHSCTSKASLNLGFYKIPVLDLGRDSTICNPENIILDAGGDFTQYNWSTNETTSSIVVKNAGQYRVRITDKNGCSASDSIKIAFVDRPKLDLSRLDTLYCGTKSAQLALSADKGAYTLERPDIGTVFTGLDANVPVFGSFPFKFTATDSSGCSSDTTFKVGFYKTPTVNFSIDSTTCYHYNLAVQYIGDATVNRANFTWVFGGDTLANGTGMDRDTIPLGINRLKRDLSLIVSQDGCSNSYTLKDIKVIPNLNLRVIDSVGCAPFTAKFMAENTEMVTYDWDFGDGGLIERKDKSPFHIYQSAGYYDVKLKIKTIVASGVGCFNEVKIDSLVHVAPIPSVGFTPIPEECLGAGDYKISYLGTGNAFDRYIWNLNEFDNRDIIQNPGETAGPLIFNLKNKPQVNIGLNVISKYGCLSDTAAVLVKRKPVLSMDASPNAGCTPLEVLFHGGINDQVDQVNYAWDFGDGANGSGGDVNHTYTEPDHHYDVLLTAVSSLTGCFDTLKSFITTHPKPVAVFNPDNKIVYNDLPKVNFSNASTGATAYLWDFGDGTTSDLPDPIHNFASTGYKTVVLEALNDFLCSDTASSQILVAYTKIFPPNAFSPNAPNPIDREFKLYSEGLKPEGYHFVIFSRWDDIVFETRNEITGWDGRMKNGKYAPAGNYVWILDFVDFLDRRHRQTGTVTLIF